MIRVLIADDHALVRRGLREIMTESGQVEVVVEATNAAEALEAVGRQPFDVAVLDLALPGRGGLELLADIKRVCPALPVLILTVHPEEQYAVRALRGGASGYLTKETAPETLMEALQKVASGGRYVSASLAERLAVQLETGLDRDPHEALSDREHQVFRMLALGSTVSAIAAELSLSVKTVSTYRARVLEKMGLRNNAELMQYAFRHRLVE